MRFRNEIEFRIVRRALGRSGIWFLTAACAVISTMVRAQTDGASDAEEEVPATIYVDRLINDGLLAPVLTPENLRASNTTGNLRSIVTEFVGASISSVSNAESIDTSRLNSVEQETGLTVSGRYQTDNFGLLGLDAQLRRGSHPSPFNGEGRNEWTGLAEFTSDGLPLGSGWIANSSLGTTSTPLIELFDTQARFFLPVTPIRGGSISLEAYRPLERSQPIVDPKPFASLNLSAGEPSLLGGLRLTDYTGLSGLLVSGGGQLALSSGLTGGIQAIAVNGTRDPFAVVLGETGTEGAPPLISSRSIVTSMGLSSRNFRLLANAIWSTRSGRQDPSQTDLKDGSAYGASIDAIFRRDRAVHSGGLYYYAPGLTWGPSAILSNAYGGYYRFSTSSQRWRWTFNIDAVDSVDGAGSSGIVLNTDTRRNLDFATAVGINTTLRVANGQSAGQVLSYIDFGTAWGTSRAEAGWSQDNLSVLYRIGLIQNWSLPPSLPAGSRLSTQVSFQHRSQSEEASALLNRTMRETTDSFSIAASAGLIPFKDATIDATIAYSSDASAPASEFFGPFQSAGISFGSLASQQSESFSGTIIASARLSESWTIAGTYTDTTSSLISRFGVSVLSTPLGPANDQFDELRRSSFRLRAAYLTLRFSASAGRPVGAFGVRQYPVGGTGNLEGRVFLDENENGRRDPAEVGASGIIVILDGVQAVRTNEAGYYRFDGVADGSHRLSVNADNLPLPWAIDAPNDQDLGQPFTADVKIPVRTTITLDIAASRR